MVTRGGIYLDADKISGKVNLEVYTHPLPRCLVDGQISDLATNLRVFTIVMSRSRLEKLSRGVNGVCIYWKFNFSQGNKVVRTEERSSN